MTIWDHILFVDNDIVYFLFYIDCTSQQGTQIVENDICLFVPISQLHDDENNA